MGAEPVGPTEVLVGPSTPHRGSSRTGWAGLALVVLLAGLLATPADAQSELDTDLAATMPEIAERSIAFHGGDTFLHATVRYDLCSRSGCVDVTVERDGGLYVHDVRGQIGGADRRIRVTNDTVELWTDGAAQTVAPGDETRWRDAATSRIYHAFLPFRLSDPSVRFADRGIETWGERTLHRVDVGFVPNSSSAAYDRWSFWFDPESARLEQFAYSYRGNPDGLRFRRLHTFRRVGGLLFADQTNLGWEGPGLTVWELDADAVRRLRHVSDVTVRDLTVRDQRVEATGSIP